MDVRESPVMHAKNAKNSGVGHMSDFGNGVKFAGFVALRRGPQQMNMRSPSLALPPLALPPLPPAPGVPAALCSR